jgi:menaquinone-specific isochorismate synthase
MQAHWDEPAHADFAEGLRVIQNKISHQEIHKAVPVIFARSTSTVTAQDRARLLLNLLDAPTTLYVYGFWQNGEGVLGATPETLFEYSEGRLKTMALAGTCPKEDAASRESLLEDPKEMLEHRLVVEDIKAVLAPYGKVQTQGPHILELPTLYHLQTNIELQCETVPSFTALIEKLHPTPALGVAPRAYGYKWMQKLPGQQDRARYGAPFAMLSAEEALCLVGIRNLQWNEKTSMIGSGCGVVAASELDREWRELLQKRSSVRKILGLNL